MIPYAFYWIVFGAFNNHQVSPVKRTCHTARGLMVPMLDFYIMVSVLLRNARIFS